MKGIIMGGGHGTRLYPSTRAINKSLIPVYDKPMIYYPVTLLLMAGVTDILIMGEKRDLVAYQTLLGDGSRFGLRFRYEIDRLRYGTAGALINARHFIGSDRVAIALGDNVFIGEHLCRDVTAAAKRFEETGGAMVFCHYEEDSRSFGVVEYDGQGNILSLQNRSQTPISHYAVTGLFFFDNRGIELVEQMEIREDGTISLPEFLRKHLQLGRLHSTILDETIQWFDAGTPRRLLTASEAVRAFQDAHGKYAGCIEETAAEMGLIDAQQLRVLAQDLESTEYGEYLIACAEKKSREQNYPIYPTERVIP